MTKYIHYGSPSFQPDKFQPIKNQECGAVKLFDLAVEIVDYYYNYVE